MSNSIDNLSKKIKKCQKCPLWQQRTQAVPGEGTPKTKIILIGEAPGQEEDKQGRPFCGQAGKLLNKLLKLAGLERPEVFITNIVKCRPPANRDPLPEEIKTCWPWLVEQMKIIKPKLIITLGRHAMNQFLPGQPKISKIHGHLIKLTDKKRRVVYCYPVFHPAAALYHNQWESLLEKDFKKLKKIIKEKHLNF